VIEELSGLRPERTIGIHAESCSTISGLVLAAGLSRRMGTNKLLLPFGERTILGQVVAVLQSCPLDEIVVVTGHEHEKVEEMLGRYRESPSLGGSALNHSDPGRYPNSGLYSTPLRFVYNPNYATGEMLSSIQAGLAAMREASHCDAALIVLGDQPLIERRIVEQVIAAHKPGTVVIPSFNRRGGHPILIDRACWPEVLALPISANLREALRAHTNWPRYIEVDTESILRDMDTPEDYARHQKLIQRFSAPRHPDAER